MAMLDNAGQSAVDTFWSRCGRWFDVAFPRCIEAAIERAVPLRVIKLPRLTLRAVEDWLRMRGRPFSFNCRSRAVRGCLVAFGGRGIIFIDEDDPEDEQRFTVAHELAHFLVDYWLPRLKAIEKFRDTVPDIAKVMDGLRPPRATERFYALMAGVRIGIFTDLMERDNESLMNAEVWQVEDRADQVALAILAPPDDVFSSVTFSPEAGFAQREECLRAALIEMYGLPESVSKPYTRSLLTAAGLGPSWIETFGLR